MKPASVFRFPWPCTYTPTRGNAAAIIESLLMRAVVPADSALRVIIKSLQLPFGENTYIALRALDVGAFHSQPYITLHSPMVRAIKYQKLGITLAIQLPNVWHGLPKACILNFRNADDSSLIEQLAAATGFSAAILRGLCKGRFFEALEARLPGSGFAPVLIAIANFVVDAAQPAGVNFRNETPRQQCNLTHADPEVWERLSLLQHSLDTDSAPAAPIYSAEPEDDEVSHSSVLLKIERYYANEYVKATGEWRQRFYDNYPKCEQAGGMEIEPLLSPEPKRRVARDTRPVLQTMHKVISEFSVASGIVRTGLWDGPMTGLLKEAILVVCLSEAVTIHPRLGDVLKLPRAPLAREMPLSCPNELFNVFGLTAEYPDLKVAADDPAVLRCAALRIMVLILIHGWQRSCSLIGIELWHFIASRNFTEIVIPSTKGGEVDQRIPAWALFPTEDLAYLRKFIVLTRRFNRETRLTELAGMRRFGDSATQAAHNQFCEQLGSVCEKFRRQAPGTHVARAVGLSWAAIRGAVVTYPELLAHPYLAEYLQHPWFSPDCLERFHKIVTTEATDSVEVFRRVACWSTPYEFRASYCRLWELLTELHRYRLHGQQIS